MIEFLSSITWADFVSWAVLTFILFIILGLVMAAYGRASTVLIWAALVSAVLIALAKTLPGGPLNG